MQTRPLAQQGDGRWWDVHRGGTWEWLAPNVIGDVLPARGTAELTFDIAPPGWTEPGCWWTHTCWRPRVVVSIAGGWMRDVATAWFWRTGWEAPPDADAKELADAAHAGEEIALRAFGRGAAVCDLDLVVVGGGVAKSGALQFDPLREAWTRYAGLDFIRGLRLVPAESGGDAGLLGAAYLASLARS